ncbi:MAG: PhoH family protein [Xanthomonadales bacterium]|nr:PhoH family protein [Xanthomonadales bacterium]
MTEQTPHRFTLPEDEPERLANVAGPLEEHLRMLEQHLGLPIAHRGGIFEVSAEPKRGRDVERLVRALWDATAESPLDTRRVEEILHLRGSVDRGASDSGDVQEVVIKTKRGLIRGRGANQARYLHAIATHDINFGVGPAGTGKTFLAVAMAVEALERARVQRILLVRPAVEAGEKLGFLPGDLTQKVDPYLRPLYDALYEMLGVERVGKLIERNVIEIAPLAYMRGRTLNDAFVILDEAQNTSVEQMKMFLTRIGFGSTAVVTGDLTQIDLPKHQRSGLRDATEVLKDVEGISFSFFGARDVVRHPLVARIVRAYDRAAGHEESAS